MKKLTKADLELVINAARQHYKNTAVWRAVSGEAYFQANITRAENRAKLGEAIRRLEESDLMKQSEETD